ncbi:DEA(D/H)-box RNA helicase family protein [Trifolium repens]|nr:DEA(D/H)-box RNA helicase family protein [Trifolium repens]
MILIGGVEVKTDMKKIEEQGANILISTPGRLHDLMNWKDVLDFKSLGFTISIILSQYVLCLRFGLMVQINFNDDGNKGKMSRTWIIYNKPEDPNFVHAWLLLALGLHGFLRVLSITDIFSTFLRSNICSV